MTQNERLEPILTFGTRGGDAISEEAIRNILNTHPVSGVLINGDMPFVVAQSLLALCRPTPVPVGLYNHPQDLYLHLRKYQRLVRAGFTLQPDVVPTLFIFAGPWLIHGIHGEFCLTHFKPEVFADLYRLFPDDEIAPATAPPENLGGTRLLAALMSLEDDDNFPGRSALVYMDEHKSLEWRGLIVFFTGVAAAALGIFALAVGAPPVGRVLAGLGAAVVAVSFLSNWAQYRLRRRTEDALRQRFGGESSAEEADALDVLSGTS